MAVLYLTEQGATLRKQGATLVTTKDDQTLQTIPAVKVQQVVIFGNISLTTPVIDYLLQEGIDCVFCNSYGKYHGRLVSNESNFGQLRLEQMLAVTTPERRLAIAREMVRGKLTNQRTLLMRYHRSRGQTELGEGADTLQQRLADLDRCADLSRLQGMEGAGSAVYYSAFKDLLQQELGFTAQLRRPPPDPVNSLLSFGYTLLTYDMQAAVRIVGLDPFLGFLHSVEYSRPSLPLDLIEEFRAIIVDSIVLRAVNTRALGAGDFHRSQQDPRAVLLTQEGMKKFLNLYEERVESRIRHPATDHQVTYRRSFELQVRYLARVIRQEVPTYVPFLVK
jgi:CRISPR-associated protein Cas1